jgi:hypothetical protein
VIELIGILLRPLLANRAALAMESLALPHRLQPRGLANQTADQWS